MDKVEFENQYSLDLNKYIVLYSDNDIINDNLYIINDKYTIKIVKFLLNSEEKKNNKLIEIYPDNYSEDILIKNSLCVLYLSNIKRSENIIKILEEHNKYIIFEDNNIIDKIKDIDTFVNSSENDNQSINIDITKSINDFKNIYNNIKNRADFLPDHNHNIKIENNKVQKIFEKDGIHIVTFFKNSETKILNVIQKKCIFENIKNKNVKELLVIGKDLEIEFSDIIKEVTDKKIILHEFDNNNNISYKDLLNISENVFNKKIICLVRSDIVLPNQNELEDLDVEFEENKKDIYSMSRVERLVSGHFVKSEKLNKILFSTEQDGWLFKSPLNIDTKMLENIYFYNKYSELYFNQILKLNNYIITNNTSKFKIIRILYDNNINERLLLNSGPQEVNLDDLFLLPDNENINKIPIDKLFQFFNLNEKDLYTLKCELFNKYLKNKIMSEL
jgi:hypothetical protein